MTQTILVADDNLTVQRVACDMLSREGLAVVTVANGVAAIKKIAALKPLVVLADVDMPGKDGYEVCEFVKAQPDLVHVRVLLAVSDADPYDRERGERVRSDGVIKKPFDRAELSSLISKSIEQAQALCLPPAVADKSVDAAPAEADPASEVESEAASVSETASSADPVPTEAACIEGTLQPVCNEGNSEQVLHEAPALDAVSSAASQNPGECPGVESSAPPAEIPVAPAELESQPQYTTAEDLIEPVPPPAQTSEKATDEINPQDDPPRELARSTQPVLEAVEDESSPESSPGPMAAVDVLPEQGETPAQELRTPEDAAEEAFEFADCPSSITPESWDSPETFLADADPEPEGHPLTAPLGPTAPIAEAAVSSEAPEKHAATQRTSFDVSLVASIIHAAVKRIAPPAFSPEMVLSLERTLSDEIIAELSDDPSNPR